MRTTTFGWLNPPPPFNTLYGPPSEEFHPFLILFFYSFSFPPSFLVIPQISFSASLSPVLFVVYPTEALLRHPKYNYTALD